ncbi:uncharacterized protein H6S33_011085 [Morchella sextelata]|uniref:uncharacterized protein n=1 Tax=Morchella sextelata TaxID=1174677 RepID=UPI001D0486DF|nr:uncharacterized protein H6S33_011085 [Morchella sextelata]KAH0611820.1 hypothetical protein H6S33_011085 [Morchella sextelata]
MSTPYIPGVYTNPTQTRLPPISVALAPAGPNTTAASRRRNTAITRILNPVVPGVATDRQKAPDLSTGPEDSGIRHTSEMEICTPSGTRGDPILLDSPSASGTPSITALPFQLVVLPTPGLTPRDAHHLRNLNLALTTHATRPNYERLHDALLCLDYALKRAPYNTHAVYQPMLDAWMLYKDRYLEYESRLISLRLIPEPHNYTVVRNKVLVRNVWPEWVPGMLVGRREGEVRGPGGRRVEGDLLVGSALANMVFLVGAGRRVGLEAPRR